MPDIANELPQATLRAKPEDFVVEEIPAYPPQGEGPHLFITFRKTGLTSAYAVRQLAGALGVDPRETGIAGNKDRHAITTQTASFLLPHDHSGQPPEELPEGIEVLAAARHGNKLRTGHLRGNRFIITLRGLPADAFSGLEARLTEVSRLGVPNAYGPQRFGRYGDNVEKARAWLIDGGRAPRDRKLKRLLFSALQSELFNKVLEQRVAEACWATVVAGDLAQKRDSGGVFWVEEDNLAADKARAAEGAISPTGPMFGSRMRWPRAAPGAWEREVLDASSLSDERLRELSKLGRGARRTLRLWVSELSWQADAAAGTLATSFVLPKGGYATTVLSRICRLADVTRPAAKPSAEPAAPAAPER